MVLDRTKNHLRWVSIILLIINICLITSTAFRDLQGADTASYGAFYDGFDVYDGSLDAYFIFEPLFTALYSILKYFDISYSGTHYVVCAYSVAVYFLIYKKVTAVNFIIFSLIYLSFIYWPVQWSTIRACMAFWTLSWLLVTTEKKLLLLLPGLFHFSFLIIFLFKLKFKFKYLMLILLPVVIYYFFKYFMLDNETRRSQV